MEAIAKKYQLFRKPSNSPSPGHDYYLFTEADSLDELFDNWVLEMKRGGFSITPDWVKEQKIEFDSDKENYFITGRGSFFYKLKTNLDGIDESKYVRSLVNKIITENYFKEDITSPFTDDGNVNDERDNDLIEYDVPEWLYPL